MDAKLSPPSVGHRRPSGIHPGTRLVFGLLLMAGTLIQACSDNNGSTGPTFACRENASSQSPTRSGSVRLAESCTATPAPVVGDGTGGATGGIVVRVVVNPGTVDIGRRASVLVIATSKNGAKLGGVHDVVLTSSLGSLDSTSGTLQNGVFTTTIFLSCDVAPATGHVVAIVDGAPSDAEGGAFSAVTATSNNPC